MSVLADTSAVIDPTGFDWGPAAGVAISVLTLAELGYGVAAARDPLTRSTRAVRLQRAHASFLHLPVDLRVAEAYGLVASAIQADGHNPRPRAIDLLIAATALAHGLALYTRDLGDLLALRQLIDIRTPAA